MASIAPLTPLRYRLDRPPHSLATLVAPPYDVISSDERARLVASSPHNVVELILPAGEGDAKYDHAAALLADWVAAGVLARDDEPAFYRYDQTFTSPSAPSSAKITRRGFLALVRLAPFSDRIVLPHERTLSGPKEDRLKLFRATRTNLSPGFMLYRDPACALNSALAAAAPLTEFSTHDGVKHALAKVTDRDAVRAIISHVAKSTLLIADGHHRYETALHYRDEVSAKHPNAPQDAEFRYFMAFLTNADDPNLVVFPTHRLIHSLAKFSFTDLLRLAAGAFQVTPLDKAIDADSIEKLLAKADALGPSVVAAAAEGTALLTFRQSAGATRDPDVVVLHSAILERLLSITPEAQAAKTNIMYRQDSRSALASVRSGGADVLFLMNPTRVAQVQEIAEKGGVMPQKSTFFYPKVLTGLTIHTLDPHRRVVSA